MKLSLLNPSEFQKGLISVDGCGEILFEIQGAVEQVEHAKLDCLALIDEMVSKTTSHEKVSDKLGWMARGNNSHKSEISSCHQR